MTLVRFSAAILTFFILACNGNKEKFDASGTFEADEIIVSSELNGKILSFNVDEGSVLSRDSVVGTIDAVNVSLQKEQVEANIQSLREKLNDVNPQIKMLKDQLSVQDVQMNNLQHEKSRIENLLKQDAATGKQLDDMNFQIESLQKQMNVTKQQINVQRSTVATQNRGILSEAKPLSKNVALLEEQLSKSKIINPAAGTVLATYAEAGEITSTGKALYKIADLTIITLRAYVTAIQLSQIRLGQQIKVLVDDGKDKYKELPGTISWVSDKAEFTPKTIQTKDERANLVYAIKVRVKNDGYLKIGMYGEVKFQ